MKERYWTPGITILLVACVVYGIVFVLLATDALSALTEALGL